MSSQSSATLLALLVLVLASSSMACAAAADASRAFGPVSRKRDLLQANPDLVAEPFKGPFRGARDPFTSPQDPFVGPMDPETVLSIMTPVNAFTPSDPIEIAETAEAIAILTDPTFVEITKQDITELMCALAKVDIGNAHYITLMAIDEYAQSVKNAHAMFRARMRLDADPMVADMIVRQFHDALNLARIQSDSMNSKVASAWGVLRSPFCMERFMANPSS